MLDNLRTFYEVFVNEAVFPSVGVALGKTGDHLLCRPR